MLVSPISGIEDKEIAIIDVSMGPGASSPRHTHPGDCYGAVLDTVELVARPEPRRFGGQAWHNHEAVHSFRNVGESSFVSEHACGRRGKPRTRCSKRHRNDGYSSFLAAANPRPDRQPAALRLLAPRLDVIATRQE
jgi:hypothetical protein